MIHLAASIILEFHQFQMNNTVRDISVTGMGSYHDTICRASSVILGIVVSKCQLFFDPIKFWIATFENIYTRKHENTVLR
jgi:hypothetical protein